MIEEHGAFARAQRKEGDEQVRPRRDAAERAAHERGQAARGDARRRGRKPEQNKGARAAAAYCARFAKRRHTHCGVPKTRRRMP